MDMPGSSPWVEAHVAVAMDQWSRAAGPWTPSSPESVPSYSTRDQRRREQSWDRAFDEVRRTCRRHAPDAESRLTQSFARFASEALDLGPDAIHLLTGGFLPVGKSLARWARRFDSTLTPAEITQAARNAWTACGMQPLFGAPLRLTPSILAYSLLYPYSDNYLDQPAITQDDKIRFSHRFRSRLRGVPIPPGDPRESAIWHLVHLIEQEFPRSFHAQVFDSLLAIHAAQEESVRQLQDCGRLDAGELLRISCAKGGASVLADACLVRGFVTREECAFAFLWGVLLQLGDDLQDIAEDLARGSDTLFTRAIRARRPLDPLVSQLLNLSEIVALHMDLLPHRTETPEALSRLAAHKSLLRMSWRSLIFMAVAQAHIYFTPAFLARMEPCSPFRFAFLRRRKDKLTGDRGLFHRIFAILLSDANPSHCEGEAEPNDPQLPFVCTAHELPVPSTLSS